jgi:hypothetical protein
MNILIGNTGLIGNMLKNNVIFDLEYNSKNIEEFTKDLTDKTNINLWLSCLPATKWLVNQNIEQDINNINKIIGILKTKKYNNIVLISTIDVYSDSPIHSDETYYPNFADLNYGSNRLLFEYLVKNILEYNDLKIFRLPALFSKEIKKNILYDLINSNNVEKINVNSFFQWYNLENLCKDILHFTNKFPQELVINLFTEPIHTEDIVVLFPHHQNIVNHSMKIINYDYKTKFSESGYLYDKKIIMEDIKKLIDNFKK